MRVELRDDDLVLTGLGAVSAVGVGKGAHLERLLAATPQMLPTLSLKDFKAANHLPDRKILKMISHADSIGMVAVTDLLQDRSFKPDDYERDRIGVYVGAMPATASDNAPYMDGMVASRDDGGRASESRFGLTGMGSRPTTLLLGLANNVLCYSTMLFDARGPNSNYTDLWMSSMLAIMTGARRLARRQLDLVVAGGFAAHTDVVCRSIFEKPGFARPEGSDQPGTEIADGAAFITLERRGAANARGATPGATYLAGAVANDGLGPQLMNGSALHGLILRTLAQAKVAPEQIGLILANQCGYEPLDQVEMAVLTALFSHPKPAMAAMSLSFGNLIEAAGVLELALFSDLCRRGYVPSFLQPKAGGGAFSTEISERRTHALIVRASPWGEYGCIVARAAEAV